MTDLIFLSKLDDKDLLSTCLVNKNANQLCKDEKFWRTCFISRYDQKDFEFMKDKVVSWRTFMLLLIKYLDLYPNTKHFRKYNDAFVSAAEEGLKELVEFFILKGADNFYWAMNGAAQGGHRELVEFLISKGELKDEKALNWGLYGAAYGGHKDLVDFFISQGANDWNYAMSGAASGGHKELVDFFVSLGAKDWRWGRDAAHVGGHKELEKFFEDKI